MRNTRLGQTVEIEVFGLRLRGVGLSAEGTVWGTVVGVAPGAITVRVDGSHGRATEVTVGPERIRPDAALAAIG